MIKARLARAGALSAVVGLGSLGLGPAPVGAHTDSDVVAVPAGEEATVDLEPNHGCGDSPTVEVSIRAPLEGATAGAVEGWTANATPDGDGNTVLAWTGGSLPADQAGAFPVTFVAPDAPGELLTFPSIQVCEDGEELAWISGDPATEYPAPRLLVLPPGSPVAPTIDDVPADAPGRSQLVEIVDVDGGATTTTAAPTTAPTTSGSASTASTTTTEATASEPSSTTVAGTDERADAPISGDAGEDGGDGDPNVGMIGGGLAAVAIGAVGVALILRRRQPST